MTDNHDFEKGEKEEKNPEHSEMQIIPLLQRKKGREEGGAKTRIRQGANPDALFLASGNYITTLAF